MAVRFTCGDEAEAVDIMREAARWLGDIGRPMWDEKDLTVENLQNSGGEFWVMWDGTKSVAAMMMHFEDRFFWPGVEQGTSGFIHKLSVRREYASKGYARMMVEHARKRCTGKGLSFLMLDCDPHRSGLMRFYVSCGFELLEIKSMNTKKIGQIDLAMFEMKIGPNY